MSRSFRKHPCVKDPAGKYMKRYANKKVRHTKDIPSGGAYKKVFESWEISDYCWLWTRQEAIDEWENEDLTSYLKTRFKSLEEYLSYWEKCVRRK